VVVATGGRGHCQTGSEKRWGWWSRGAIVASGVGIIEADLLVGIGSIYTPTYERN